MSKALQVLDLSKSFPWGERRLRVLSDLSLEVEEGTLLAVTGASGSGKSTLLHLLGVMEAPDSGRIRFYGRELTGLTRQQRALFRNREIGFVFQFHHLLPEFSALENVMMPLLLRGTAGDRARDAARRLLSQVGLAEREQHRPGELSGGEQQRVAVARALVGGPRLLLADEPTGNLDERTSESIHHLLLEIQRRAGITAVVVTHDARLASLCDRVCRLEEGRLVET